MVSGGGDSKLTESLMGMLGDDSSGGLKGLVNSFKEKGMGDLVSSWIGSGENSKISADQIQKVLGKTNLEGMASKLGVSYEDISNKVSEYLPQIIDKLTPDGKIPDNNIIQQGLNFFNKK